MGHDSAILSRFPAHFEATRPGKLLGAVVAALARDLDVQSAQLAGVRRAHRLRDADPADLLLLGALHAVRAAEAEILSIRFARAADRATALDAALTAPAADRTALALALLDLWSIDLGDDPLTAFVTPPAAGAPAPDAESAAMAAAGLLLSAVAAATSGAARQRALSARIIRISANHAQGNGTVRALLEGAATALDLDILSVAHSQDRFLHAAETRDRLGLVVAGIDLPPAGTEVLGIEENPVRRAEQPPAARRHAECFEIFRKGFDPARLEIALISMGAPVLGPMVVNRDQGRGIGYAASIPAGQSLLLSEAGRAVLAGADVTAFAYGFLGAVFADATAPAGTDAGFDAALFVVGTPAGALDTGFVFPHAGDSLIMPDVAIGRTRMGFFVQEAHFGDAVAPDGDPAAPALLLACAPRPASGLFTGDGPTLGSVFAPGPDQIRSPAALVSFAWREHEAYKVRVLIPPRFRALSDDPDGIDVTRRVTDAIERFRPLGIAVETMFTDDRWVLGQGTLANQGSDINALFALTNGTTLWPAPDIAGPPGGQPEDIDP